MVEQYTRRSFSIASYAFAEFSAGGPPTSEAGSRFRSSSVMPWVFGSSVESPICAEPSGSSCAARWPKRRIDSARFAAPTMSCRSEALAGAAADGAGLTASAGTHEANASRVAASTDWGSCRYLS